MSWINNISITLFNVPLSVVFIAAVGALASHAYDLEGDDPSNKKGKKFWLGLGANTLVACAFVSVIPGWFGWQWYNTKLEGSMAFIFALVARFMVPLIFKSLPELFRKWTGTGEYKKKSNEDEPIKEEVHEAIEKE